MSETPIVVSVPGQSLLSAFGPVPGVEFIPWDLSGPAPRERIDIVVPPYMDSESLLPRLAGVDTWLVQSQSIGFNGVAERLPAGQRYANAATVHEPSTAELALALTLAAQRGLPDFVRAGDERRWAPARHASLADRRVLLLGYGGVSRAVEDRIAPFEVTVTRVARSARVETAPDGSPRPVHAFAELPELLPHAEIVIVAVPLTPETAGMIDDAFLAALPDGALLVNVARGPVVDQDALIAHLTAGRIRAAVDVVDPEPLPAEHPLWGCPNLLISPHVGGASSAMLPRMAALLRRQIERFRAGEAPENVVIDPAAGAGS